MPEILDAPLTEKGRQQALALQPSIQEMKDQPELVVFSPNCRALQTGRYAFGHIIRCYRYILCLCWALSSRTEVMTINVPR